ncbi:AIG2-like protein D [Vitis vinifera]|uniref:Putative gamma-glutamylcyclotransferase n=1 Tax=Vitis vinifera TaxID=29760 RepID=A0A438K8R7_VITVI|nr:AIG2-like protein D [Vitis vinifera]
MAMASSAPQNLHAVFVYGSLLADEVVAVLLNRVPQSSLPSSTTCQSLHSLFLLFSRLDFGLVISQSRFCHRFSIKGRVYPAILPVENKKVTGRVLLGVTDPELNILDTFEDVEYDRRTVEVSLMDGPEKLQAKTYVWRNSNDTNLYGDWDFEQWKGVHMENFVKMTMSFVEELELPESMPRVTTYETFFQQGSDNPPMS